MGQRDIPTTSAGLDFARSNISNLPHEVSWIVSSSLLRASETASVFSRGMIPVQLSDLWAERNWGPFEGHPKVRRSNELDLDGVEAWCAFVSRVRLGVSLLPSVGRGMVVSHSGVFKALLFLGYRADVNSATVPNATPILLQA